MRRLYSVVFEYRAVVWAKDETEIEYFEEQIADTESPRIFVQPIDPGSPVLPPEWDKDTCLYHRLSNRLHMTVGEAIEIQKEEARYESPGQPPMPAARPPRARGIQEDKLPDINVSNA